MRPGPIRRIARWEVLKGTDSLDRRTVAAAVIALVVAGGVTAAVAGTSVSPDAGLYRIGVASDSPFHGPAAEDPTFVVREPDPDELGESLDLVVVGDRVEAADDRKGRAALSEFRETVVTYNDRSLREDNQSAAFPVQVDLRYVSRSGVAPSAGGDGGAGDDTGGDGGSDGGSGDGGSDGGDGLSVPRFGGQPLFSTSQAGTPGGIAPPFPFGALVLAFLFVVPMNFVIQAYGASILRERIDRRGELLLVAPVSPGEIVAGKTLPYLLGLLATSVVVAVGVGGGLQALAAVVPIALLFLAATFVAGMFARSFKELTFLTVTISVGLTAYLFVPAIFTEVTPIALISPLTVVVMDLLGEPVAAGEYLFSTVPFYLSSAVLFLLGVGVYREEDMFTQRAVHRKALDAFASRIRGLKSVAAMTAVLIPFVLVGELLVVALLFALPLSVTVPVLLVSIAAVEELAKSVHVFAGYEHERFERSPRTALAVGAASGLGFFLGEKLTLLARFVQLQELPAGRVAFTAAAGPEFVPLALLLVAPLALHVGTAAITATGASRDARWYAGSFLLAVLVHAAYNLGVVWLVA